MNSPGVVPKAHVVIGLASMALLLTLAVACGEDSTGNEAPPAASPTVSAATRIPGDDDETLLYAIENPVLECRDGESWVSIRQIGNLLGDDTVIMASPIKPDADGYPPLETMVTSSRRAADVIGERDYLDDTFMAATVEAKLPAFLTDSDQPQFVILLTGTYDETGEQFISNGLMLETSAARC